MADFSKPARLLAEGRVQQDRGGIIAFRVEGDHGRYHTVIGVGFAFCDCPARGECTHIAAGRASIAADGPTRAAIHEAIERRNAPDCGWCGEDGHQSAECPDPVAVDGRAGRLTV